jgi:hypothetical protein
MTVNALHHHEVDDPGLTSEDRTGLQYSCNYGASDPAPGTAEAWLAARPARALQAEPAREAGQ